MQGHIRGISLVKMIAFTFACLSILARPSLSWTLPEIPFLEALMFKFQREGISIFLPNDNNKDSNIVGIIRHFR